MGKVIEVLGDVNEKGVDTEIIIRKFGIPDAHGEAAHRGGEALRRGHARATSPAARISARPSR